METITQLLNEIEKSLQQLDHPCVDHLNPGYLLKRFKNYLRKFHYSRTRTCMHFIHGEMDQKIVRESHSVSWHFFLASI